MDAKNVLGYGDRPSMGERVALSEVQDALDKGASFKDREAARTYGRHMRRDLAIFLSFFILDMIVAFAYGYLAGLLA